MLADHASTRSTSPASLFSGLFTRVLTGYTSSQSSGAGSSTDCSACTSVFAGSSHASHEASGSITGMREWIGSSRSLARVVMIAHVRNHAPGASGSSTASSRQISHKPANAMGSPSRRCTR